QREARAATSAVLGVLGQRLAGTEPGHLAAQLPEGIAKLVAGSPNGATAFGVDEFVQRVAAAVNTSAETAKWDASAVLCTVAEAVTGGELTQILTQLQPDYALLFGKPELF